jgi:hypothetical protein
MLRQIDARKRQMAEVMRVPPETAGWSWHPGLTSRALAFFLGLFVGVSSLAFLGLLGLPANADGAGPRGAPRCKRDPDATTIEYLVGVACPPDGFASVMGYEPVLVDTPNGWRYTRPASANGNCSGPVGNTGLFWSLEVVCQTHDYGYDLVRMGVGDRPEADRLLYLDMKTSCEHQSFPGDVACRTLAGWARVVLASGDALGFDPKRGPRSYSGARSSPR